MKKLLVLMLVLSIASVANAVLTAKISVDGVIDTPDTDIILAPSDTVTIDIHAWNDVSASGTVLLMQGLGALDATSLTLWEQSAFTMPSAFFDDYKMLFEDMGYAGISQIADFDILDLSDPFTVPNGIVLDGLILHCLGEGDVILTLFDADLNVLDSQIIHQIPEPASMLLLGLGGLLLRRRK